MSGEFNLEHTLQILETGSVTERQKAISGLRPILENATRLEADKEPLIHRIFQALFSNSQIEFSTYQKSKTATLRSTAEKRLAVCTSTLRRAVEVSVKLIRLKTTLSIIRHVIETMRLPSGGFCEPLALDYAKCLRMILSYPPHVEHLGGGEFENLITFCVDCVKQTLVDLTEDHSELENEQLSMTRSLTGQTPRSFQLRAKDSNGSQAEHSLSKQLAEEMVACMALLTSAPNAKIGVQAEPIILALLGCLRNSAVAHRVHQDVFATINQILVSTRVEDTALTKRHTTSLVRFLKNFWSLKQPKNFLISWIYLLPYIRLTLRDQDDTTLQGELLGAIHTMQDEYSGVQERDQLHLDDLCMQVSHEPSATCEPMRTQVFRLRCVGVKAENTWTLVSLLASLIDLVSSDNIKGLSSEDETDRNTRVRSRKRQKMNDEVEDLISSTAHSDFASRLCAIQIVAFLVQQRTLDLTQLTRTLDIMSSNGADENPIIASWAMLVLAAVAFKPMSSDDALTTRWNSIWYVAIRAMAKTPTCRAACHLLVIMLDAKLVAQALISELVQSMLSSMDLAGPSILADSSSRLLRNLNHLNRQIDPVSASTFVRTTANWLCRKFTPSKFEDKVYAGLHTAIEAAEAVDLVANCLSQSVSSEHSACAIWGPVGLAWLMDSQQQSLLQYLLLEPENVAAGKKAVLPAMEATRMPIHVDTSNELLLLNHLTDELTRAQDNWTELIKDRPQQVSIDGFSSICNDVCISAACTLSITFRDNRRCSRLRQVVESFLSRLYSFISSNDCRQIQIRSMQRILYRFLSGLREPAMAQPEITELDKLLCRGYSQAMSSRNSSNQHGSKIEDDLMDQDDGFDSQEPRHDDQDVNANDLRDENVAKYSIFALQSGVTTYATLVAIIAGDVSSSSGQESVSSAVVEYLLSLPRMAVVVNRALLSFLQCVGVLFTTSDALRLLEYCTEGILESYAFERSEVTLGAILDIFGHLCPLWTDTENIALFELGSDMYGWFTGTALQGGALSSYVQKQVASLLLRLCRIDTDYGRTESQASVRTSLFTLVQIGRVPVQYYLAGEITNIFDLFVLSAHAKMFDDLQENLPDDALWAEGMAMRLIFLAKLAARWHSLLRQSVYYLFETAGRVKNSAGHATRCIGQVSREIGFDSSKGLFSLFAPQLLHTWLENHSINDLPFTAFQYNSLAELLQGNEAEVFSQLLMRGNERGLGQFSDVLGITASELAKRSFAKCLAYCICWDISKPPAPGTETTETRLRNLVGGKDQLRNLAANQFPVIVGHFFLTLQQDNGQESWLDKHNQLSFVSKSLAEIRTYGCSVQTLPPSQQPSFKRKYLFDQVARLCRRTSHDPVNPWDISSLSLCFRMLLDGIDPALGPLQAALMIRRIRLLVCMASDVACSGHPVEMLTHALRPYLSEAQCAEDAIGLMQYLLQHSQKHLQNNLPFLHGTTMLAVLQMRAYARRKGDRTTQESQHQATLQKMQHFQTWLVRFAEQCRPVDVRALGSVYQQITTCLAQISLPGNARKNTPESELLLILLRLQNNPSDSHLHEPDCREAIGILTEEFDISHPLDKDCLSDDTECASLATSVWQSLQISTSYLDPNYQTWAAIVLGRAYAATGISPRSSLDGFDQVRLQTLEIAQKFRSQAAIALQLCTSLNATDCRESSLADYTLRSIAISLDQENDATAFDQCLSESHVAAISGGTFGYQSPLVSQATIDNVGNKSLDKIMESGLAKDCPLLVRTFSTSLCREAGLPAILPLLIPMLDKFANFAANALPSILHLALEKDIQGIGTLRSKLSSLTDNLFQQLDESFLESQRYLLKLILFLKEQEFPGEKTVADRSNWLQVDLSHASEAAARGGMFTTALYFLELASQRSHTNSRRSSGRGSSTQSSTVSVRPEFLLSIYRNLEEPDSFYGVEQPASLPAVLDRLDYEEDGFKSLMIRSGQTDVQLRRTHQLHSSDMDGMIRSLSMLNMNSLNLMLLNNGRTHSKTVAAEFLSAAQQLQQWDIASPELSSPTSDMFSILQDLNRAKSQESMQMLVRKALSESIQLLPKYKRSKALVSKWFPTLASLVEMNEVLSCTGDKTLSATWRQISSRHSWMQIGRLADFQDILNNQHTLVSVLTENRTLQGDMQLTLSICRKLEIECLLNQCKLFRHHGNLQVALSAATQLNDLAGRVEDDDHEIHILAKMETALTLWDFGEQTASIRVLQEALSWDKASLQGSSAGRSGLLAQVAYQLAEARLEKPDEILSKYLEPAIRSLEGRSDGDEAGRVFHEFATFCDKQLQNQDNIEDFSRITRLRQNKLDEVKELEQLAKKGKKSSQSTEYKHSLRKAKQWYDIDDADYRRLKEGRDTFAQQSVQNYLLALHASDHYNISILRFFALWLESASNAVIASTVKTSLPNVPSWKFVQLLNQLMSRLDRENSEFQGTLHDLLVRIISDHPYHSLHHLYASTRKPQYKEQAAMLSRYTRATAIRQELTDKFSRSTAKGSLLNDWILANNYYNALAWESTDSLKGNKIAVKDFNVAHQIVSKIPQLRVPPATINITLRPDCTYANVPVVVRFESTMRLMGGLSKPKKLTAIASDGQHYAALFKSGNDDLRQDAIMEQVFEAVSNMLKEHKETRQRNLQVRTYKVIPLQSKAGIIEFVPNSTSLNDFLQPAHARYHPGDYKPSHAREKIQSVKDHSTEVRVKEFKKVCDHMHPVLRHFFFEHFPQPDEWFDRRTAYTRTTASVSILGYVLGLGDRHCQNIMLDEKTGEVVHIDLGVAFEAGRVLPIPELVPFRLTRDIVDGMGITKTEGIFRRCCEFTLDALRRDKDSIMTLLNVLRYDPLYQWTISPIRAKRMQEESEAGRNEEVRGSKSGGSSKESEAGEAERALSIVEKKLSKTLSTSATVNELIQQATDERNLATLFSGWSAYF